MEKDKRDKLNALKSELASLKHVKLGKRINIEKIEELEKEIKKIINNT